MGEGNEKEVKKVVELAVTNQAQFSTELSTDIANVKTIEGLLAFGEVLLKSQLTPLKSKEDIMIAVLTARTLGIPEMSGINNIHPVNGRGTLGVNIYAALAIKAGIVFTIIEDFQPVKVLVDGIEKMTADKRTTINFKRKIKQPDGTYETMEMKHSIRMSEMELQKLTEKDNWMKMPRTMLRTRTLTTGLRLIAADIYMGIYETTELLDANNVQYVATDDTEFTEVQEIISDAKNDKA